MSYLTLIPAYGRDYKSKKEVLADWNADKDFIIADFSHPYDGKPMNQRDAEPGITYNIRYKKLTQICQACKAKTAPKAADATPKAKPFTMGAVLEMQKNPRF